MKRQTLKVMTMMLIATLSAIEASAQVFSGGPYNAIVSNADELKIALTAAQQSTTARYYIFLKNGVYDFGSTAKTAIPKNTSLIGESQEGVIVKNNPGTFSGSYQDKTPVLYIDSEQNDVYLQDMTICQARDWETKVSKGQALALRQRGKRAIYKNVTMQGVQDTYYLNKADGSAYFETSTIAGNVDYIYGDGTMWFEKCHIQHIGNNGGYVTAPNTQPAYKGVVFNLCNVTSEKGDKSYHLGRPWGDSPAATYLNTTFHALPKDAGWAGMESGLVVRFHEYGSMDANGNLLDLSARSISACNAAAGSDSPVLTAEQAAQYTIDNVFQPVASGWQPQSLTQQLEVATVYISTEKKQLTWQPVADAYCYAIVKDGSIVDFTVNAFYSITDLSATYQVRVANKMGGLGVASAPAVEGWVNSLPAFPGADGYAKYVSGGRGGKVYYVTRNDDCPDNALVEGTLRWALNSGDDSPRTVLFATNGTIYLTSRLKLAHNNVSILGQSAPGGGICLAGYPLNISKNNVIVRYIRFRAGDVPNQSLTGLSMENCQNVILDHCSLTWSMEECLTAYDSKYTTVQWCIIGEGLYSSKNAKGARAYATQWGGEHSTMHHTLITNSHSRSPRFNGVRVYENQNTAKGHDYQVDSEFANNVIYNWSTYNAIYGGEMSGRFNDQYNRVYLIGNYYRPGPSTKKGTTSKRYWVAASAGENSTGSITAPGQWYLSGNKFELSSKWAPTTNIWSDTELQKVNADNLYGYDNNDPSRAMGYWSLTPSASLREKSIMETLPYALSGMQYESADEAFANVTTKAGASLPRYDEVDSRILAEAAGTIDPQFTGSINEMGIIDSPDNITLTEHDTFVADGKVQTNYPFLGMREGDKYAIDSDADGMPDAYEQVMGLNPADASDGAVITANGYSNLENYLNGIVDGTVNKAQYETSEDRVLPGTTTPETANFNVTFTTSDAAVEGSLPEASVVESGKPFVLPSSTSIYKEGHTFKAWECEGMEYAVGEAFIPRGDVSISPVFTENALNLPDRKATIVTIEWDFTSADAPVLADGKAGVYTTSASIMVTTPPTVIDACLRYNGNTITLPSDNGATFKVEYADASSSEYTADTNEDSYNIAVEGQLSKVTCVLPKVSDGIFYHRPASAVEIVYLSQLTAEGADEELGRWIETNSTTFEEVTALDPVIDDGMATTPLTGIVINGTMANATKLTMKVTGVKQLKSFVTMKSNNATVSTTSQMIATPNDGTPALIKKSSGKAGTNEIMTLDLDPAIGYSVAFNCSGDSRGRFALTAVKMVADESAGINSVHADYGDGAVYSIEGIRMPEGALRKGVYIQNGKKLLIEKGK